MTEDMFFALATVFEYGVIDDSYRTDLERLGFIKVGEDGAAALTPEGESVLFLVDLQQALDVVVKDPS